MTATPIPQPTMPPIGTPSAPFGISRQPSAPVGICPGNSPRSGDLLSRLRTGPDMAQHPHRMAFGPLSDWLSVERPEVIPPTPFLLCSVPLSRPSPLPLDLHSM
ncbi:hypothetical protein PISMIDRAFT_20375 [Pisolithus microcarpus 441]|uniref:Uncharacterized protein n=1 Tax=Pisolithus microcarpus 441 TaxID=765257 RepID=A0A0C9XDX2_9AGAM|nr:hypothetical protein PISMIDRAFT_20375 [Pisolithus microcarpus 441]